MAEPWLKAAVALSVVLSVAVLVSAGVKFILLLFLFVVQRPGLQHQPTRCFFNAEIARSPALVVLSDFARLVVLGDLSGFLA